MATTKQRKTATILMESMGKKSVSQAMKEAGYPDTTTRNPQQLTRSKSWETLIEEYLPEESLAKLHSEQLKATVVSRDGRKAPDNDARLRALDYGYKIRGKYPKNQVEISFIQKYQDMTDEELDKLIQEADQV